MHPHQGQVKVNHNMDTLQCLCYEKNAYRCNILATTGSDQAITRHRLFALGDITNHVHNGK